jgi:hypothetical protein
MKADSTPGRLIEGVKDGPDAWLGSVDPNDHRPGVIRCRHGAILAWRRNEGRFG